MFKPLFSWPGKKVITTLKNWIVGTKKSKDEYRIYEKYALKTLTGEVLVVKKIDDRILTTKKSVLTILQKLHADKSILKGQRKTNQLVKDNYDNIFVIFKILCNTNQ